MFCVEISFLALITNLIHSLFNKKGIVILEGDIHTIFEISKTFADLRRLLYAIR